MIENHFVRLAHLLMQRREKKEGRRKVSSELLHAMKANTRQPNM
jgi:hypothetical protein